MPRTIIPTPLTAGYRQFIATKRFGKSVTADGFGKNIHQFRTEMRNYMSNSSRRTFLVGSGTVTVGAITGLAGCLDDIRGSDDDDRESNDGPAPLPSFHEWLYVPDEIGIGAYTYTYVDGEAVAERSQYGPTLVEHGAEWTTRRIERLVSSFLDETMLQEVDSAVSIDYRQRSRNTFGLAVTGGFDTSELRSEFDRAAENESRLEKEAYAGYDLYVGQGYTIGLGGETRSEFLFSDLSSSQEATEPELLEAMIDARNGDGTRLHAADETAETLLRRQGDRTVVFGAPEVNDSVERLFGTESGSDEAPSVEAGGLTVEVAEDETTYGVTLITEQAVSDAEAFGDDVPALDRLPDPAVSQDGVVITYESGGDGTDGTESDDRKRSPQAGFDIDVDLESNTATVVHVGGDEIAADELRLICTGSGFQETWAALSNTATVSPGDRVSVPIAADDHGGGLLVQWTPESEILYAKSIPDGSSTTTEPAATFDFEFDFDRNTVRVAHTSGDEIPASEIELYFDSRERRGFQWDAVTDDEIVSAGDSAILELTERDGGGTVVVIWSPDGSVLDYEYIPQSN